MGTRVIGQGGGGGGGGIGTPSSALPSSLCDASAEFQTTFYPIPLWRVMTQRVIKRICSKGYGLWLNGTRGPVDASTTSHDADADARRGKRRKRAGKRERTRLSRNGPSRAGAWFLDAGKTTLESSSSVCICPFVDASRSVKTVAATRSSGVAVTTDRNGTNT